MPVVCSSCVLISTDDGGDTCGLAKSRSRREKREKLGRKSALDQLKKAKKGEKIKYEVRNVARIPNNDSHCTNNIFNSWLIAVVITSMTAAGILYFPLF